MKKNLGIMLVKGDTVGMMNVTNPLIAASGGVEAFSYPGDERNKRPGIILLDLNVPGMNGIEFLAAAMKWGTEEYPGCRVDDLKSGSGQGGKFRSLCCRIRGKTGRLCSICGSDELSTCTGLSQSYRRDNLWNDTTL